MTSQIPFTPVTPEALAKLNPIERDAFRSAAAAVAAEQKPSMGTIVELVETIHRLITSPVADADARAVARLLTIICEVDAHIDAATAPEYREQPLAAHWARVTKVCEEAGEVWAALSKCTGENPRKGVCGSWDDLLEELGDTVSAAACAIQHITKDTDRTSAVIMAAFGKAYGRIPAGATADLMAGRRPDGE